VLVANPSLPANSIQELVALAKKEPGKITYAGAIGASPNLAGEMLKSMAGINLLFVSYRGQAPAQNDVLSGVVNLMFGNLPDVMPYITDGKMKALGIATLKRSALAPQIPTFVEAGFPGFEWDSWYGVMSPAKTPKNIIDIQQAGIAEVLANADVKDHLLKVGLEPNGSTPDEFKSFLEKKMTTYAKVIKDAHIHFTQ
jgi:tripartite-type tricarboxylate transporter receptor subunit TctC